MMHYRKILKLSAAFMSIALLAAGCGGGQATKREATIVIWQPFTSEEALRPITQAFQQANKGIRIQVVEKKVQDYEKELIQALAADKGPDIFAINNTWVPDYMDKIAPAPENVWRYVDFKNDFVDVVSSDFTKANAIYGAAFSVDTLGLYYNKALLADSGVYTPPATWGELQTAVRKLSRQNDNSMFTRSGVAMGHSSYSSSGKINRAEDILYLLMLQMNGQGFKPDGSQPTFGNSVSVGGKSMVPAIEALRFYTSFALADNPNYTWNALSDYSIDAFANGRAAMMLNYSYAGNLVRQKNSNLQFDTASAPQRELNSPAVNFANYWGQVVSKKSQNADVAWAFLKFATQKDQIEKYLAVSKEPSSRKDLIEAQKNDPSLSVFAHAAATAKSYFRPHAIEMDKIFGGAIDAVVFMGTEPQAAVTQAVRQAQAVLQRKN